MYHMTSNRTLPYPQNLVCDVLGQELAHPPHDLDDSVEYILETQLKERDAFILILRYFRAMTIREIAAYYGLSAQRITQIIQKALRRMRHPSCSKYLQFGCAEVQRQETQRQNAAQAFQQDGLPVGPLCAVPR